MALREYLDIRFSASGGLNFDADPQYRRGGDYAFAKNIHFLSQAGRSTYSVEPTLGNIHAYTLPFVSGQSRLFRIYVDAINNTDTYTISMFNGNSVLITTATWASVANDPVSTGNSAIAAMSTALNAAAQTYSFTSVTQTSATEGYFDFGISTVPIWDYSVSLASGGNPDPALPIIIQEGIDLSLAGPLQQIGSYDLNGDLFLWSTTQTELPSELDIANISASGVSPLIRITIPNHGLTSGERVVVKNATSDANGTWIINVIDADNFDLLGSVFITAASIGTVTINPSGIGEIGVAQKNDNDQTWTYTTLLRSKELNFVTKRQIKTACERNDLLASLYWTDNYNRPRKLYYAGPYVTNGALTVVNSLGEYQYGSIGLETLLIRSSANAHLTNFVQLQSGGAVPAGNHLYAIQLLTENLTATLVTDPSNPCPVYVPSDVNTYTNAQIIEGNAPNTVTSKVNQFTITGIIPNLFKYVELIDIYFTDTVPVATVVRRDLLTQQTTQIIQHTGLETETRTFDIALFLQTQSDIFTALNIDIISNRLTLSNTSTSEKIDFSAFTRTFRHNVKKKELPAIRDVFNGTLQVAEYQPPENVFNYSGYMLNEIYRYSAKFRLKNGVVTQNFWIDDIRIDDYIQVVDFNRGNPFGDNRRNIGGSLPDMNITDSTGLFIYNAFVEFTNIDWDFLVDGVPVRDLVDEILIERVEMAEGFREVLGSGVVVMGFVQTINEAPRPLGIGFLPVAPGGWSTILTGQRFSTLKGANQDVVWSYASSIQGFNLSPEVVGGSEANRQDIMEYPWAAGIDTGGLNSTVYLNTPYSDPVFALATRRNFCAFYSPDILFSETVYQYQSGDKILSWGAPTTTLTLAMGGGGGNYATTANNLREFTGFTNAAQVEYALDEGIEIGRGSVTAMQGNSVHFSKAPYMYQSSTSTSFATSDLNQMPFDIPTSPVFHIDAIQHPLGIETFTGNTDFGVYQSQIYRPKINKFGDINNSNYIPTGAYLNSSANSVEVFGGDTLTQKIWMKHIRNSSFTTINYGTGNNWALSGSNQGLGFYAQNRVNSQMINRTDSSNSWKYPLVQDLVWLNNCSATSISLISEPTVVLSYNPSYTIRNGIISDEAFDPNLKRSSRQPARVWWSDVKSENSIVDNYTNFLPLNFRDLQLSFGPINEHKNINGQLMTWQDDHYEFQYFDFTGLLVTNAQETVLGNAGVMAQRGTALSTYGTSHGFSVIKGKTAGGKDAVYWISTKYGKVMKHDPSQGTTVISDIQFMRSFFNNNLTFASLHDTPADGEGIHGVWDDINSEVIWTVRATKTGGSTWNGAGFYPQGTVVRYNATDFHGLQVYYRALEDNSGQDPTRGAPYWQAIPLTDSNYYNAYTIAFNEVKNKFTTFYSFLPKIYSKRGKSFLSPRPVADERMAYEHLRGDYCAWYASSAGELAERWSIEGMTINEQPNVDKAVKAVMWNTLIVPDRIDINTKNYSTFMVAADCERRQDQWNVAVKNDTRTSANGLNDEDTSMIFGTYAEVSLSGPAKTYQKFINFILKVRAVSRLFNT